MASPSIGSGFGVVVVQRIKDSVSTYPAANFHIRDNMHDNGVVRKWVIGVLVVCLIAIVGQEAVDAFRPKRPDEELIVNAAFTRNSKGIARLKNLIAPAVEERIAIEADWTFKPEFKTFDQAANHWIHELETLLPIEIEVVKWEAGDAKEVAIDQHFLDETQNSLNALRRIRDELSSKKIIEPQKPRVQLRALKLNPNIVLFTKKSESLLWKITSISGATSEVISTIHLAYPMFSKDGKYACLCVRKTDYGFPTSMFGAYFLARTRSGWKVVAEGW